MIKRVKRRTALYGLVVGGLLIAGYLGYRNSALENEWPVTLDEALIIPMQRNFDSSIAMNPSPVDAQEAFNHALNVFRFAANDVTAIEQTGPLLRDIWMKWHDSDIALRAQLFYLRTLQAYGRNESRLLESLEFVEHALLMPHVYFSGEYQASTQYVVIHAIEALLEQGDQAGAWHLCVKLRWFAPRIELIVPLCHSVAENASALAPKTTLDLLSPLVSVREIPAGRFSLTLAQAVQAYLSHPYDAESLSKTIIELYKGGFKELSAILLNELMQIDPVEMPGVEAKIDALSVAE